MEGEEDNFKKFHFFKQSSLLVEFEQSEKVVVRLLKERL